MPVDVRRMSLMRTALGPSPLLARVQDVFPASSPGQAASCDAAFLDRDPATGRPVRRLARVRVTAGQAAGLHRGDLVYARGVPSASAAGGLVVDATGGALLVEHVHGDDLPAEAVRRLLDRGRAPSSPRQAGRG